MDIERVKARKAEKADDNWAEVIRFSFLFSQGSPDLQELILKWMVNVPFEKSPQLGKEDVKRISIQIAKSISQMSAHGHHVSLGTSEGEEDTYPKGASQGELFAQKVQAAQDEKQSSNDTYTDPGVLLERILKGMLERDINYLDKGLFTEDGKIHNGRPVDKSSRRDQFSSFLIDFAVLGEGDGYFNWKGLPDTYKQMLQELRSKMKSNIKASEVLHLKELYIKLHPDLSEEKRQKIEDFFS